MVRRGSRGRLRLAVRIGLAAMLVGGVAGTTLVTTNAFGVGDRFERLIVRIDRFFNPPPDRPIDDERVVSRGTPIPGPTPNATAAGGEPSPATVSPIPTVSLPPEREPIDIDMLAEAEVDPNEVFASQVEEDMCAPAGVQITLAALGLVDTSEATQRQIHRRVREWESWQDSHNGEWGPTAIARALAAYGAPGYKVRVYETRSDALFDAARAISSTGKPVILLTWRGAHTWVMTGYRADADPLLFPDARITGAYILDPWYPRVSSLWGRSDPPGTFQDDAEMKRNYLAWKRPEGRYQGRDGRFIAVVPVG